MLDRLVVVMYCAFSKKAIHKNNISKVSFTPPGNLTQDAMRKMSPMFQIVLQEKIQRADIFSKVFLGEVGAL